MGFAHWVPGSGHVAERVACARQDAFAEVYELDVEGDVNRVLFALPQALTGAPDRPGAAAAGAVHADSPSGPGSGAPNGGEGGRARRRAAGAARAAGEGALAAGAPWGSQRWAAGLAAGLARLAEECAAVAGRETAASGVGAGVGALARLDVQEHLRRLQAAK
jgi:hypothetical protein